MKYSNNNAKESTNIQNENIVYGTHPVEEALYTHPQTIEKLYIRNGLSYKGLPKLLSICREHKIPVSEINGDDRMKELAGNVNHQGIVATVRDFLYIDIDEVIKLVESNRDTNRPSLIIIMDELTDTQNVGAIIRTAVGADATAIIIPKHRQAPITGATVKAAAGTVNNIPIARVVNISTAIERLKSAHIWVASLAMDSNVDNKGDKSKNNAQTLWSMDMVGDMAIVIGNEGEGVHKNIIDNSDYTLSIPMNNKLESLNASVSAAIAMYEWKRQNNK